MDIFTPTIVETYTPLLSFIACGAALSALMLAISPICYLGCRLIDRLTKY